MVLREGILALMRLLSGLDRELLDLTLCPNSGQLQLVKIY